MPWCPCIPGDFLPSRGRVSPNLKPGCGVGGGGRGRGGRGGVVGLSLYRAWSVASHQRPQQQQQLLHNARTCDRGEFGTREDSIVCVDDLDLRAAVGGV